MSATAFAADKPEFRIGSVVAMTGPASALGLPEKNALELLQEQIAKDTSLPFTVKFITYDDASDPTKAVNNVRKLITEDQVHVVICCSTTPTSMAILETVTQAKVAAPLSTCSQMPLPGPSPLGSAVLETGDPGTRLKSIATT